MKSLLFRIKYLVLFGNIYPRQHRFTRLNGGLLSSLLLVFSLAWLGTSVAQSSPLVYLQNGSLQYETFAMTGQTNAVNVIPDFSYAGYQGGGVALPNVPVVQTLMPSGGDDTQMIQFAINIAEALPPDANGFRGAVLLTAGCYQVDQLFIEQSGVVLRGEGQGSEGTVLYAKLPFQHDVITIQGSGGGFDREGSSVQPITTPYVAVGDYSFEVADASGYFVGGTITVRRTPNQFWIDELGMDEATLCAGDPGNCNGWTPGSYSIYHERVITAISGNTITVDLPIVDVMETQYGGGEIYRATVPGRIEQCGVENLRIESYFDPNNNQDENHAWIGVKLRRAVNSWVQNVTGQYLGYATVSINDEANFNTVQECAFIDPVSQISGGRRYCFNISDGLGNLFQRNYTSNGRHDFVTGARVTGPNVFLDSYSSTPFSDIGPHHRWATGLLFDNIRGGEVRVRNRGSSGSGHGWSGNTTMFWNLLSESGDIWVDSPTGGINWGIGCQGVQQVGAGYWDNWNSPVLPRSLYLQQLEDRLGTQAVNNVTIPEQQTGNIYDLLAAWAGEGEFGEPASSQSRFVAEDATVRGGSNADTNYGTDDNLNVKNNVGSSNNNRRSFLKFNLSGISAPVYNVKLRLSVTNTPPGPTQCALHLVNIDGWSENSITWNNQPGVDELIGTEMVTNAGSIMEFDLTDVVNDIITGDGVLSLRLSEASEDNLFAFGSKERGGTDRDPTIVYTLTPNGTNPLDCATILPVTWSYFVARPEQQDAVLEWGTAEEENHEKFVVEHSTNGHTFRDIGEIRFPAESSGDRRHYTFHHQEPVTGANYYRIRQVDVDGTSSNSVIRMLIFERKATTGFTVYPNPTEARLRVRLNAESTGAEARIYTSVGQLVFTTQLLPVAGVHELRTEHLVPGLYYLTIGGHTKRFVKE